MKKVFFFALASLALASCSQDEEFAPEKSTNGGSKRANSEVLSFSTYTAGATRADIVGKSALLKSGFTVAAWYDDALYFNEGETASVAADGKFDTDGDMYYWPSFSAGKIGFRAFNNGVGAAWTTGNEYKSIGFTVEETAADQKDLVIAYADTAAKPEDGVMPLNFTHALSRVNFSFVGEDTNKYTINKIELIAAGGDATMSFAETTEAAADSLEKPTKNSQADKVTWAFTHIDNTGALVSKESGKEGKEAQGVLYTYFESTAAATDSVVNGKSTVKFDQNFMLLPQADSIAVRVYYKVEKLKKGSTTDYNLIGNCGYYMTDVNGRHDNGNDKFVSAGAIYGCKTVIISLGDVIKAADDSKLGWEAGKSYRFTITLPNDNFIGDKSGDGVADESDDDQTVDYDGDTDKDESEFDKLTPIRFSVTVSAWEAEGGKTVTFN